MIGYLNYHRHPQDRSRRVFYYRTEIIFELMKNNLEEKGVDYESEVEDDGTSTFYIIVAKKDFDVAFDCNTRAMMSVKQKLISNRELRVFVIVIFIISVGIAFTGFIISLFK